MSDAPTVLVTGATGRLGSAVCRELVQRGQCVRATDQRYARDFPLRVELGDLLDELFAYRVLEGCDAVVHLANHPNQVVGLSRQRLLGENVRMNANVFQAALDQDVRVIVFSSSVQLTIRRERERSEPPYAIPYLPLDGRLPPNPGRNAYALSKEFGERMLRLAVENEPGLSATSLRLPMLVGEWFQRRVASGQRVPLSMIDLAECTAHLFLEDAARLVAEVLARRLPGYHQYFPAETMDLVGCSPAELVRDHYPGVALRQPLDELAGLVDVSEIERELGWKPEKRLRVLLDR